MAVSYGRRYGVGSRWKRYLRKKRKHGSLAIIGGSM
jgi:hypothetical protein